MITQAERNRNRETVRALIAYLERNGATPASRLREFQFKGAGLDDLVRLGWLYKSSHLHDGEFLYEAGRQRPDWWDENP